LSIGNRLRQNYGLRRIEPVVFESCYEPMAKSSGTDAFTRGGRALGLVLAAACTGLMGCERAIEVELPDVPQEWVVEGRIELGQPPVVFLSQTQGYFDPVDSTFFQSLFLGGATVRVGVGDTWHTLDPLCLGDLPPELQAQALEMLGLPEDLAGGAAANFCVYTDLEGALRGTVGTTYDLEVTWEGRRATARNRLLAPVPLESIWFQAPNGGTGLADSLGWLYAQFADPPEEGQAYRWFARRINQRPAWDPLHRPGEAKDADFISPLGSAVEDRFFNGLAFTFNAIRGSAAGSTAWDDQFDSEEWGYFKRGDTVVVKFCTIDPEVYRAIYSLENQVLGQGNPFAVPAEVQGNVIGARGLWAAYGAAFDTVVCEN
jgi:hypothetical protein